MLEGPGHEQRAAPLLRSFQVTSRAGRARWPMRRRILQARNVGLLGLGCALGAGCVLGALSLPAWQDAPAPRRVYYMNCRDALLDGVTGIRRGEPGYRPALDADNDGVACEPYRGP